MIRSMYLKRCLHLALACTVACWSAVAAAGEFTLEKTDDGNVTVNYDGKLFTKYLTDTGPKPILYPIIGPSGAKFSRDYPMKDVEGERKDHPHHRSLWFTHGDVNGIDFWAETKGHGFIKHLEYLTVEGGKTGKIVTRNSWEGPDGKKIGEDVRTITFLAGDDYMGLDYDVEVKATEGKLTFGDTKEGAFGIRIPTSMDVDSKKGGQIVNSEGQMDKAAWGKQASWVDYHGPVGEETLGVAILNHPTSYRYPTYWHVRTYGLFAANPFGLHHFLGDNTKDGSATLEKGESLTLRHRVIFHSGDEKSANIAEKFKQYASEK